MRQTLRPLAFLSLFLPFVLQAGSAKADGLLLTYKVDTVTMPAPQTTMQNGKPAVPHESHQQAKVYLYPDYLIFDFGARLERLDFTTQQDATYLPDEKKFLSTALAARPIGYALEKTNRLQMEKMLTAAGIADKLYVGNKDLYAIDIDTMMGVQNDKTLSALPAPVVNGAKTSYALNGKTISDITYSDKPVPEDLKKTFTRFLAYGPLLHPQIEKEIANNGHLLAASHTIARDTSFATESTWTLEGADAVSGAPPAAPEGYTQTFTNNAALDSALLAGNAAPAPTLAAHEQRVADFMSKNDHLRAALEILQAILELGQQKVQQSAAMTAALKAIATDPAVRDLMAAIGTPPKTPDDLKHINAVFVAAKTAAPEYAALIDVFNANQVKTAYARQRSFTQADGLALQQADKSLVNGIIANPRLIGAYCDVAQGYFGRYEVLTAFAIWQQAEHLQPGFPNLAPVEAMKQRAEKDFPEYF